MQHQVAIIEWVCAMRSGHVIDDLENSRDPSFEGWQSALYEELRSGSFSEPCSFTTCVDATLCSLSFTLEI